MREDLNPVVDESVEYFDGLQETWSNIIGGELKIYNREMKLTAAEVGKNMRTRTVTKTKERRGLGGWIAGFFVGDKEYQDT